MAKYDDIVEGYQEKQADLRRQIAKLKGQVKMGTAETGTAEAIRRIQRQVVDLDGAIARCREKTPKAGNKARAGLGVRCRG